MSNVPQQISLDTDQYGTLVFNLDDSGHISSNDPYVAMVNQMTTFDGTVYDLINYQYVNQGTVRRSDNLQFFDPSLLGSGIQSNSPLINFGNYIQNPDWWSKPTSDGGDYNIDPNMTAGYLVRDSDIANYLGDPMSWNYYGVNTPSSNGINRGAIGGISGGKYVMPTWGGYDNTAGWIDPSGSIHTEGQDNPEWWQSAILAIASYVSPIGAIIGTVIGDVITGKPINPVQIGVMAAGSLVNAGFPAGETLTDAAVGSSGELINGATGAAIVNSAGSQAVLDEAQQQIVQQAATDTAETAAGAAAATDGALPTAETAAAAGDAYLPGALSNPFLQAMPTLSSMSQAAATNAAMQLATTGKIDPEKVLASIMTSAAGSTAGNLAGNAAGNALDSNLARSIVSGAVNGATQAGINGTDPMAAALASGAASGLGYSAKENGINVPQQVTNALVTSIATGAPLEKTLLSAAMSMGVGAAKDAISGLSSADTQAPAPVETRTPLSPDPSGLDSISTDQGRTGTDALFYDEQGNALDASGNPVYGSHNDVLTDPVTGVVTQPVTTPVTSTVIPKNTSTTTGGGLSTISPSSSAQTTPTAQPISWLTNPSQSGLLTVKKDPNMISSQLSDIDSGIPRYAEAGSVYDPFAPLSSVLDPKKVASEFVSSKPTLLSYKKAVASPVLSHAPLKNMYQSIARGMAEGGLPSKYEEATPKGHKPEFITGVTGFYADGKGTGQSDDIPALLHDGDYVMDAETVSALGDGSSKAGREVLEKFRNQVPHESKTGGSVIPAKIADGEYVFPAAFVTALGKGENKRGSEILDGLREKLRAHKRKAPLDKIPPKAKSPLEYLKSKV